MSVLHEKLDDVLGPDQAVTLMALLPPVGWGDVARRSDVDHLGQTLRAEVRSGLDGLRAEMHRELGGVHQEFGEVRKEIGQVRKETGHVRKELVAGNRQMVFAIIASQFTAVSLAFAAMTMAG